MAFITYHKSAHGLEECLNKVSESAQRSFILPNLLRHSTTGLEEARAKLERRSLPPPGLHTNQHGHLMLSSSLPTLGDRYTLVAEVGHGTFSRIFMANTRDGHGYAIKVIKTDFRMLGLREACFLRYFNAKTYRSSKHFVGIHESFQFEQHLCLVLELCRCTLYSLMTEPSVGGSSSSYRASHRVGGDSLQGAAGEHHHNEVRVVNMTQRRSLHFQNIRKIALGLVSALDIMHKSDAMHADIKPENCLLSWAEVGWEGKDVTSVNTLPDSFEIRLGDFGNAMHVAESVSSHDDFDVQTLAYRAPEVLLGVPFDQQIDMWSLGVVLLELCIGKSIFLAKERGEMLSEITRKLFKLPLNSFQRGLYFPSFYGSQPTVEGYWVNESDPRGNSGHYFACLLASVKNSLSEVVENVPAEFVHLLAGLLHPDPTRRLSADQALRHPFLACNLPIPLPIIDSQQRTAEKNDSIDFLRARLASLPPAATIKDEPSHRSTASYPGPSQASAPTPAYVAAAVAAVGKISRAAGRGRLAGPRSTLMSLQDSSLKPEVPERDAPLPPQPGSAHKASPPPKGQSQPPAHKQQDTKSDSELVSRLARGSRDKEMAVGAKMKKKKVEELSSLPKELKDLLEQNSAYADEVEADSSEGEDGDDSSRGRETSRQESTSIAGREALEQRSETDYYGSASRDQGAEGPISEHTGYNGYDISDDDTASLGEAQLGASGGNEEEDEDESGEDEGSQSSRSRSSVETFEGSAGEAKPRPQPSMKRGSRGAASPGGGLLGALPLRQTSQEEPQPKKQKRSKGTISALAQLESL